jgi:hypothetical protein
VIERLQAEVIDLCHDYAFEIERDVRQDLRADKAEAEVERLRAAGQRCMEISTGLAAAGIVGHMDILDVMGAALHGEGEK